MLLKKDQRMSFDDLEVNVGGTKFKGVYLAILLSFGSTLGGGIWAASEFFSRLETLENDVASASAGSSATNQRFEDFRDVWQSDKKDIVSDIEVMKQQLQDNDISGLQGKLAELGTNLATIMERQRELLGLADRIVEVEKKITEMQTVVQRAEIATEDSDEINKKLDRLLREVEDLWDGLDYLANPYSSGGDE